eukprot:NODE_377_length_1569_cov_119.001387_g345_i0.p1 GENE.NODE_377_length_1569_cov_119.001387_g345_i0~~NODE_377_length_1569_cov_119.001387_g345_i0.p1  ORF type:complete len:498 (-),score=94.57 NODE_377_length_1569_cov_119.001387_g345_i0:20-1513(-)
MKSGIAATIALTAWTQIPSFLAAPHNPQRLADHVLIIGIDGLAGSTYYPYGDTPNLEALMSNGSYTLDAQNILDCASSQNWMTMIAGAGPDQHGVYNNGWQPGDSEPTETVFSVLRRQQPDSTIGFFSHWSDFLRLVEPGVCDKIETHVSVEETVQAAIDFLYDDDYELPDLTMIQMDHVDGAGHTYRWGSNRYYAAIERADNLIGKLLDAYDDVGILEDTLVILSSDHGGDGTSHGPDYDKHRYIPWMAMGPGVKQGYVIPREVRTWDVGATAAYALGLDLPEEWLASPVKEIFLNDTVVSTSEALEYSFSSTYEWLYDTTGTGAATMSFWRVVAPEGFLSLGDVAVAGLDPPDFETVVVSERSEAVSRTVAYEQIWRSTGSSGEYPGSFWVPIPQYGSLCLGSIVDQADEMEEPVRDDIACISYHYLYKDEEAVKLWDDAGSGASWDGSLWINPTRDGSELVSNSPFVRRHHTGPYFNRLRKINPDLANKIEVLD